MAEELKIWLADLQAKVNSNVGGNDIEFTMDIWKPREESRTTVPTILKVIGAEMFPYLDMEMRFNGNQDLCVGVHTKPNLQSKYLNVGSSHTAACKKAIPQGVSIRTAGLTTMTAQNQNKSLSVI